MSGFGTPEEAARAIVLAGELAAAFRRDVGDLPAAGMISDEERAVYRVPLPRDGEGLEATIEHVASDILPRSHAHSHPRSFPFIDGAGLEAGIAAAVLGASLDANLGGGAGLASEIEDVTWRWLAELIGFPAGGGHFTSGGTLANMTGLACARHRAFPEAREHGIAPGSAAVYTSEHAHNSIARACDVLGLGRRALRSIRCDDRFRIRPDELARAIETDRAAGVTAVAVVGVAGTTSTGAVDPLDALADLCAEHGIWLHVDGAYGAPAAAAPTSAPLFAGLERVDSLGLDPAQVALPAEGRRLRARARSGRARRDVRGRGRVSRERRRRAVLRPGLAGLGGHRGDAPVPRPRAVDGVPRLRRRRPRRRDRERPAARAPARADRARRARPRAARRAAALGRRLPPPSGGPGRPRGARRAQPRAARCDAARRPRADLGHDDPRRLRAAAVHDAPPHDRRRRPGYWRRSRRSSGPGRFYAAT